MDKKQPKLLKVIFYIVLILSLASIYMLFLFTPINNLVTSVQNSLLSRTYKPIQQSIYLQPITDPVLTESWAYNVLKKDTVISSSDQDKYITTDPRVIAMRRFLQDYRSPMYPYADIFIMEADRTGLDWRLVASISGVESAFGNIIPLNSNNGWGWKGGPGGNWSMFPTWKEGISTVTEGLAYGYGTTLTPSQIEPTYCPPCGADPAHAWANGVQKYMNELQYYLDNLENI